MSYSTDAVFGLCDGGHYHHWPTRGGLLLSLPDSFPANAFAVTYQTRVPIDGKIYLIKECPCNIPSASTNGISSPTQDRNHSDVMNGNGDKNSSISNAMIATLEEKLFSSIQKKQTELLDNFKKETAFIIKDFKNLYREVNWEVNSLTSSLTANRIQMQKFTEQIEDLESRIQEMIPESESSDNSDTSSTETEESEDILQEIEAIKQSDDRTFMGYRPLTGQCWEVSKPVVFQVTINSDTMTAIYDPRVAKSVMSENVLYSDDETDELEYDKVFYVPWWFPKLQTCRDEGAVDVQINTYHSHTLNVAFNHVWNKTVVLGFNFGQKFIDSVNEDNGTITLRDNNGSSYSLNFEYYLY